MNKVAVVTGSGAGLGKGIALQLAKDGFKIVLQDINEDALKSTEEEFKNDGYEVVSVAGDVSKRDSHTEFVKAAVDHFGQLDVYVNNAGIDIVAPFIETTEEQMNKIFAINVNGVMFGTQAAARQFMDQGSKGKILNACSIAGHESYEMLGAYSATKHAVKSLTHSASKEFAKENITVNAYCPGVAKTEMWDRIDAEMVRYNDDMEPGDAFKEFSGAISLGRYQEPQDVANLVSFLASDKADYITGQAIVTDGGLVYR